MIPAIATERRPTILERLERAEQRLLHRALPLLARIRRWRGWKPVGLIGLWYLRASFFVSLGVMVFAGLVHFGAFPAKSAMPPSYHLALLAALGNLVTVGPLLAVRSLRDHGRRR